MSTIRVVVAEVGREAEIREIDDGLEAMQAIVEGPIELLRYEGRIFFVVNEDGRLCELPPNRVFTLDPSGPHYLPGPPPYGRGFIVVGPFFIAKAGGGWTSLTEEEAEEIRAMLDEAQIVFDGAEINA